MKRRDAGKSILSESDLGIVRWWTSARWILVLDTVLNLLKRIRELDGDEGE